MEVLMNEANALACTTSDFTDSPPGVLPFRGKTPPPCLLFDLCSGQLWHLIRHLDIAKT